MRRSSIATLAVALTAVGAIANGDQNTVRQPVDKRVITTGNTSRQLAPLDDKRTARVVEYQDRELRVDVNALLQRVIALEAQIRLLEDHQHKYRDRFGPSGQLWLNIRQIRRLVEDDDTKYDDHGWWFRDENDPPRGSRTMFWTTSPK